MPSDEAAQGNSESPSAVWTEVKLAWFYQIRCYSLDIFLVTMMYWYYQYQWLHQVMVFPTWKYHIHFIIFTQRCSTCFSFCELMLLLVWTISHFGPNWKIFIRQHREFKCFISGIVSRKYYGVTKMYGSLL